MAALGSIGTSREVKEQCENMKKFVGGGFFLFPPPEPEGRKRAVENRKCV